MTERRLSWRVLVAFGLMIAAILAYVATLDDSDPDPLQNAEPAQPGTP